MISLVLFVIIFSLLCSFFSSTSEHIAVDTTIDDYSYVTPPDGYTMIEWLDDVVALRLELCTSLFDGEVA